MPFAGYKDFKDCVRKNQDKENPEAYCATIMRQVEQGRQKPSEAHEQPAQETPPKVRTGWFKGHI